MNKNNKNNLIPNLKMDEVCCPLFVDKSPLTLKILPLTATYFP